VISRLLRGHCQRRIERHLPGCRRLEETAWLEGHGIGIGSGDRCQVLEEAIEDVLEWSRAFFAQVETFLTTKQAPLHG
jgi:hypothetical protein